MICYKDMTFCNRFGNDCKNSNCNRAFTEEEAQSAKDWWGGPDYPISLSDLKTDRCNMGSPEKCQS